MKDPGLKGSIKHLFTQKYITKRAVDEIGFSIKAGDAVAYIGPNGAGKSTTIKMLTGILVPTSGEVKVDGLVPHKERIKNAKKIGVVFGQKSQLWWDIPMRESLYLLKDIYQIPDDLYKKNLDYFTEILGLDEFMSLPTRKLSLGQRMRGDIAAAFLHNPKIVYLDEPTIGLDIVVKERIRNFIKSINREHKTTVILASHDLSDIEDICDRLIIIDKGKIIYDGSLNKLKTDYTFVSLIDLVLTGNIKEIKTQIYRIPSAEILSVTAISPKTKQLTLSFNKNQISASAVLKKIINNFNIIDFKVKDTTIEDIVKKVYEGKFDF